MTAAVRLTATKMDESGYSHEEAWGWLRRNGDVALNRTFHTTARKLMSEWNRSAYWVMGFLKRLETEGAIKRQILPDNGGTLITVNDISAGKVISPRSGVSDGISQFIENLPPILSVQQVDRLSRAYRGIVYGEPEYDWADIKHLEIIEQALCASQMQQAA
ncbi:MAG: hypothetical protein L3J67_09240 [Hyphomicrobiaceae bacterium]|nr:hypothetical protein [Hyphomicrobiaceae bacterium]